MELKRKWGLMGGKLEDAKLLKLARERFQAGVDADRENRKRDLEDRKFYKGEQWSETEKTERGARPTLTINRQPQFVKQVTGEMRQNKPAIKVLPVDDQTDPELAEVYSAIIRHIESNSDAHRIYSKAGEQAVIGGIGWFRVLTDYLDDASFDQEIIVKAIRNPRAVVADPDAMRRGEPADMAWAFVTEMMARDKFEASYPKVALIDFEHADEELAQDWLTEEAVRIAEYWYREPITRRLVRLSDGSTRFFDEIKDDEQAALDLMGVKVVNEREVQTHKVCWVRMTGAAVIDRGEWKGKWIPLIPVIGEEVEVGDEVFRHGLIHHSRDAQRSYNYARSAMVEHIGSQPKAPWLVTAAQIQNYKTQWQNANKGNPGVLIYDPDPKAPGAPQRMMPPTMATAWYQEAQVADQDMKATTGIYDASLGKSGNETSGRAILARDSQGETATFVYVDNLSSAIRHAGNIILDLIPHIYTDERIIRIIGEDGAIETYARINTRLPDGRTLNDITVGRYDIEVTTGPAYATKRQEAADKLMQLVQAFPQLAGIAGDMIVKALDLPYGDKIAERVAIAMLPPGLDADVDKKRLEMQQAMGPQQPDPMQELAMRGAEADVTGKEADAAMKQINATQAAFSTGQAMGSGIPQG